MGSPDSVHNNYDDRIIVALPIDSDFFAMMTATCPLYEPVGPPHAPSGRKDFAELLLSCAVAPIYFAFSHSRKALLEYSLALQLKKISHWYMVAFLSSIGC